MASVPIYKYYCYNQLYVFKHTHLISVLVHMKKVIVKHRKIAVFLNSNEIIQVISVQEIRYSLPN